MEPVPPTRREIARLVFFAFLLSFIAARILVLLIMARMLPDLFLHLGGTHVHHLNYGIILLSLAGAYLLFQRPGGRAMKLTAIVYALGLALTFDEFGMWLHLGGSYWQRASFDAIIVIAALLALLAFAPSWRAARSVHGWGLALALIATACFFVLWVRSFRYAEHVLAPRLERMEKTGPR